MTTKLRAASFQDNAVTTAKIAADAVTAAKIPANTIGSSEIDLTADYAFTGTITGDNNGMVLLQTVSVTSNVSSVTIGSTSLFTNTYKIYKIFGTRVRGTSDGAHGHIRYVIGGATKTDSGYEYNRWYSYGGGGAVSTGSANNGSYFERFWGQSNGVTGSKETSNFIVTVYDPASNDNYKHINCWCSNDDLSTNSATHQSSGRYENGSGEPLEGIVFYSSAGNFQQGNFSLYGIK